MPAVGVLRHVDGPELALVAIGGLRGPDHLDDLDRFGHHPAVVAAGGEQLRVGRERAGREPRDVAAARHVIEPHETVGEVDRVVVREQVGGGAEPDAGRLLGGGGDHQVRSRAGLVPDRVVLGEEHLRQPVFIAPAG